MSVDSEQISQSHVVVVSFETGGYLHKSFSLGNVLVTQSLADAYSFRNEHNALNTIDLLDQQGVIFNEDAPGLGQVSVEVLSITIDRLKKIVP